MPRSPLSRRPAGGASAGGGRLVLAHAQTKAEPTATAGKRWRRLARVTPQMVAAGSSLALGGRMSPQPLGEAEPHLEGLPVVEPRVACRRVVPVQVVDRDSGRPADAFGDVLARQLEVYPP